MRRCRSFWHAHPNASLARVVKHYQEANGFHHCGPYRVCKKHPDQILCDKCGYGALTTRVWYDDETVNDYDLRCSANGYPYRYTT